MIKDLNKNIENINYNHLNLPEEIEINSLQANYIYYTYDAAGIKLSKTAGSKTTDYVGNFIYKNNNLKYILTEYGKINVHNGTYARQYNITDHLGNIRVTFDEDNILQEDSYYPFGLTMNGLSYQLKRDAKIPKSQQPLGIAKKELTHNNKAVIGNDGKPIMTREYTHKTTDGNTVIIQNHSAGHKKWNVGSHYNVRPYENIKNGRVTGTQAHYEWLDK